MLLVSWSVHRRFVKNDIEQNFKCLLFRSFINVKSNYKQKYR